MALKTSFSGKIFSDGHFDHFFGSHGHETVGHSKEN
jgi:hypothetical protein